MNALKPGDRAPHANRWTARKQGRHRPNADVSPAVLIYAMGENDVHITWAQPSSGKSGVCEGAHLSRVVLRSKTEKGVSLGVGGGDVSRGKKVR